MNKSLIDVIIPVYNEEEALPDFYHQLIAQPVQLHPIFIDNCSTDRSLEFLRSLSGVTIVNHSSNRGYGASLRAGIARATSDKIIIIDADGEYSPSVIPAIVAALDHYDVVHTSRFLGSIGNGMNSCRFFGNRMVSMVFSFFFRRRLTDLYTGCKGYRRKCVTALDLHRDGFEHVLEVSAKICRNGVAIKEIPVDYRPRTLGTSKMNHWLESVKYCYLVFYYFLAIPRSNREQ